MPLVYLYTNLKESDLKEGIELRMAQSVAETLGKPVAVSPLYFEISVLHLFGIVIIVYNLPFTL